MLSQKQHRIQAHHNQKFSNDISSMFPNQYGDWEIISMFYAALHLVDEYFSKTVVPLPTNHKSRNLKIRSILPTIYDDYMVLYNLSMTSRYIKSYTNITLNDIDVARTSFSNIVNHFIRN